MNLPNKLTMLRILLVPVFMVLAAYHWMLAAGVVFALASITDFLDGAIARKYHLVTDFGKFADPLADDNGLYLHDCGRRVQPRSCGDYFGA